MTASVFFSYSHDDEIQRDRLEKHLALLRHQGLIEAWHDRRIAPGDDFAREIDDAINEADIILLLVSASFIASKYCYSIEMTRAMVRHEERSATVIPVILKPCDWTSAPFGKLQALPRNAKPISQWADADEGYADIAGQLRTLLESRADGWGHARPGVGRPTIGHVPKIPTAGSASAASTNSVAEQRSAASLTSESVAPVLPRSSNMRLRKEFTHLERDRFLRDAFEFIARFFEGSITELQTRHPQIQGQFERVDAHRFTCTIYQHGKTVSECAITFGTALGKGIAYSNSVRSSGNSFNEYLSVEADDQTLFMKSMGMLRGDHNRKLTEQGAAELFWENLLRPLQ